MSRFSRCRVMLLLILLLLPAALQAAEPRRAAEPIRSTMSTQTAWDMLARLWSFFTGGAQSDNGCGADPSGLCRLSQSAPAGDNGCGADPDGRCRS